MQSYVNQAVSWSTTNKMIPNVDKTKDMVIYFHKQPIVIPPITLEGVEIERVKSVKFLGIIVTDKVSWNENTTYICSKASKRLYHLKQLRRAGLDSVDKLHMFILGTHTANQITHITYTIGYTFYVNYNNQSNYYLVYVDKEFIVCDSKIS